MSCLTASCSLAFSTADLARGGGVRREGEGSENKGRGQKRRGGVRREGEGSGEKGRGEDTHLKSAFSCTTTSSCFERLLVFD